MFWHSNTRWSMRFFAGVAGTIMLFQNAACAQSDDSEKTAEALEFTWSDNRPFAVVELFTSQGCSSCPPADKNLQSIVEQAKNKKQQVYALSFHVDYWNYIGWKDPFSSESATHRQRLYAGVHKSEQVYTPQMVVNGTTEFLGSNRDKSQRAISAALKTKPSARVGIAHERHAEQLSVHWRTERADAGDLLVVVLVQDAGQRSVDAGENAGRKLSHANIVRSFHVSDASTSSGTLEITLPTDAPAASELEESLESTFQLVAFIQTDAAAMRAAVATPIALAK
jgi:hypothetical protein